MNIGNPNEFTIKELAETTIRLTGSSSKIIYKPLPQVSVAVRVTTLYGIGECYYLILWWFGKVAEIQVHVWEVKALRFGDGGYRTIQQREVMRAQYTEEYAG